MEQDYSYAELKLVPLLKSLYSLEDLCQSMGTSNAIYLANLATLDDSYTGLRDLDKLTSPANDNHRSLRSLSFFQQKILDSSLSFVMAEDPSAVINSANQ